LLLQHLQLVLLLLQSLLDNLGASYDPLLHLLHDVRLDLHSLLVRGDRVVGVEAPLLEEWLQVVIGIALAFFILVLGFVLLEFFPGLVVKGLLYSERAEPHLFVLLRDGQLFVPDGLVALLLFRQQILVLLLDEGVVFLLTGVNLAVAQDFISRVLLLDGLDFTLVHVVEHRYFLLLEIHRHLRYLLLGRHQFVPFPLLGHLQDLDLSDMVVVIEVVLSRVDTVGLVLVEADCSTHHLIISVFVYLSCLLSDLFDSLDEAIMVPVRIVGDDAHAAVDLDQLLPVRQLPRTVELDRLELVRVPVPPFQLIAPMLVEVSELLYL
jgi:hypothetical protein